MSESRGRVLRLALQIVGFLAGLVLLGWCASMALSPDNTEQLERLREAGWTEVGSIMALSAVSLVLNGLAFWFGLAPVRKLRVGDVLATNAIATLLSYMPFKLGLIARITIHNRRDRVALVTIGAWFAATTMVLLAAFGPILVVSLLLPRAGLLWAVLVLVAIAGTAWGLIVVSRVLEGERGLSRLRWMADVARLPLRKRVFGLKPLLELHKGFSMLAHGPWVALGVTARLLDMVSWALRLMVASKVVGIEISLAQAIVIAVAQFFLGAASPSGQLGVREIGASGLAALLAVTEGAKFATVALSVTAVEAVVNLAGASLAVAWLRPDRLLRARSRGEERTAERELEEDAGA